MNLRRILLGLVALGSGLFVFSACAGLGLVRGQYESPTHVVERKDGLFEVRRYEAFAVARTGSSDIETEKSARDGGFMTLFRYIDGGNDAKQKIAMTTPVLMRGDAEDGEMSFVLPAEVARSGAPTPVDARVKLAKLPAATYAVLRFKGSRKREAAARAMGQLEQWMKNTGCEAATGAEPLFAYYDPPWTPEMFRRNEVLIQIKPPKR